MNLQAPGDHLKRGLPRPRGPCVEAQAVVAGPPSAGGSVARPGRADGTLAGRAPQAPKLRLLKRQAWILCGNGTHTPEAAAAHPAEPKDFSD